MKITENAFGIGLVFVLLLPLLAMATIDGELSKPVWMQAMDAAGRSTPQADDQWAVDIWDPIMGDSTFYFPFEPKGRPSELIRFYTTDKWTYFKVRFPADTMITFRSLKLDDFEDSVAVPGSDG